MIITGHGSLPASVPVKLATSGPGAPLAAAPSTSAATSSAGEMVSYRPHRIALLHDNVRVDPRFVQQLADRRADHALDPQPLLFLYRRLDAPELHEVLRLDDPEHLDAAARLARATRGEAQRDAGFRAVVDDDQVGALQIVSHVERLLR